MYHSTLVASLITTFSLVSALLAPEAARAAVQASQPFVLKAELLIGEKNKRFDGLYVTPYHTGAGLNDVTLQKAKPTFTSILNGTDVQYNLSSPYPWSMVMGYTIGYAGWQPVQINVGDSANSNYSQFFFNSSGLEWTSSPGSPYNEFGGWRVCDWWHEVPQLFWKNAYYKNKRVSSCSDVNLVPEYVGSYGV